MGYRTPPSKIANVTIRDDSDLENEISKDSEANFETDFYVEILRQLKDTYELRKQSADKLFKLIICWLASVMTFLFLAAFEVNWYWLKEISFNISDNVLIALITSTTASVLGLYVIVAKWLFPNDE
ncbi:MAG: hypothetical protein ERJ67_00845 [Aphanocapsa feldmannii 277cV]|uniref:Uncharacterized protein n=1 Tax=Aphanocapsa feldmannii 277cV TaxID=2507553 RepID=A0A524RR10_9CHRO|nr:MAG: hypothetical protein ERJ67_00845 [Aphanocapsa feldmannii 277cV]